MVVICQLVSFPNPRDREVLVTIEVACKQEGLGLGRERGQGEGVGRELASGGGSCINRGGALSSAGVGAYLFTPLH